MGRNGTGIFAGGALSAALVTGILLVDHVNWAWGIVLLVVLVIFAALAMGATLAFAVNAWSRVRYLERVVSGLQRSSREAAGPTSGQG